MLYHFILNPAAGKGTQIEKMREEVTALAKEMGLDYRIYETTGVEDATAYVNTAAEDPAEQRFYLFGGDGTLSEGANAAAGKEHVAIGVIPIGTGNDFCRNFSHKDLFLDLRAQIEGEPIPIDLLKCNDKYCVNMINMGFDGTVAIKVGEIKRNRFLPSALAYIAGVILTLVRRFGTAMRIDLDGKERIGRPLLLAAVGNGRYCGGGFLSCPTGDLQDGAMDACIVEKVSRFTFLRLVSSYKAGTHLEKKQSRKCITYRRVRSMNVHFPEPLALCIDGETDTVCDLAISVVPKALRFLVPKGSALNPPPSAMPEVELTAVASEKL